MRSSFLLVCVTLLALLAIASAGTCGGNCPGNACQSCPCGTSRNVVDINAWCAKFSGWNQAQCRCIVSHESGGNSNAMNYNTGGTFDVGLWQVNSFNWKVCNGGAAPCGLSQNLACAIDVWRWGGNTFKLWSTCHVCGLCSSNPNSLLQTQVISGEAADWNGEFPSWYNADKETPEWYMNTTEIVQPKKGLEPKKIMLAEF